MRNIVNGFLGTTFLLLFYAAVMMVSTGSVNEIASQFLTLWWLMLPIAVGFGIQVALYSKLRAVIKNPGSAGTGVIATTGATSSAGMIACCAHHLVDVLPVLGLSAFSIFLSRYQIPILIISLAINLLGIVLMLRNLKMVSSA